jgi:hypothetical protein
MSELDIVKETIAYLKFWLGIMVVSDISLIGWLLSNAGAASDPKTYGAIAGVTIITLVALIVHMRIEHLIST